MENTPPHPPMVEAWRFVVTSSENFFFFFLTY